MLQESPSLRFGLAGLILSCLGAFVLPGSAAGANCPWSAVPNSSFVTIIYGSGTGSGAFTYTGTNPSSTTGAVYTINVMGQAWTFGVTPQINAH